MKKDLIINATSCSGGGLVVLTEYIVEIDLSEYDEIILFAPDNFNISNDIISIVHNTDNCYYKNKLYWNIIGIHKWIRNRKKRDIHFLSMQNFFPYRVTNKCEFSSVYIHQALPFFEEYKWSLLKSEERRLWFYKNIYGTFIKGSIKKADQLIVQTSWLKKKISTLYPNIEGEIIVRPPNITLIKTDMYCSKDENDNTIRLFYPAGPMKYKNHETLFSALKLYIDRNTNSKIVLELSISNQNMYLVDMIKRMKLCENVNLLGNLSYDEVMRYYKRSTALVFPSLVESFGLPLIEAQKFDLPIIVTDIEIFREVVGTRYEKVIFCNGTEPSEWCKAIEALENKSNTYS